MKKYYILLILIAFGISTNAQIFNAVKDKLKEVAVDKVSGSISTSAKNLITTESITTNFNDCDKTNIKEPAFASKENFNSLCNANYIQDKGYELTPGYYELNLLSFCLKAGTHAPSKGDGYLFAPLKGPKEKIIDKLVKNWYNHQDIKQHQVQALIWAILAKANFKNLSSELQLVASKLLSPKELLSLSKMGLDFIPQNVISEVTTNLPKPVQLVIEAENKMRQLFNSSSYSYSELEKLAMLTGLNTGKSHIENGTWGLHPSGFWISYLPNGYSNMKVKIYVPQELTSVYYRPSEDVAVPANTSSQRLLLSDIKNCK